MSEKKKMRIKYAGADWVKASLKVEMSPLGEEVADLLGQLYQGIYHIDDEARRVKWNNPDWIEIVVRDNGFATFDHGLLTLFVLLCHDSSIRGQISVANFRKLKMTFWKRSSREGSIYERHPTMEEHISILRERYSEVEK